MKLNFDKQYEKEYPERQNPTVIEGADDVRKFLLCLEKRNGANAKKLLKEMGLDETENCPKSLVDKIEQHDVT